MLHGSILLTGATGLLGRACLTRQIARYGAKNIIALVRYGRDTSALERLGIRTVECDICVPGLGLPAGVYSRLAESVRSIVHAAADIRFNIPIEQSRRANVLATNNLLLFAARCPRLDKFAHMSTVYVFGAKPGSMGEQAAEPGAFINAYQQTKFEGECAVLAAMSTVPAAIYRFSTMVYDRTARSVAQFNYLHQLLRLAALNPLPAIPAAQGAKVDLIASDWAARVFDWLFEERWEPQKIIHICAGAEHSLTLRELFHLTFDILGVNGARPRLLSEDEFERHADSILSSPSRRHMWEKLVQFLPHLNIDQTFECTRLAKATEDRRELKRPDPAELFRDALSYCIASQWGRLGSNQANCPPQLEPAPAVHPKQ